MIKQIFTVFAILLIAGCAGSPLVKGNNPTGNGGLTAGGSTFDPDTGIWLPTGKFGQGTPGAAFRAAKALFNKKDYIRAKRAFAEFYNNNHKSRLATSSIFYFAECLYKMEEYRAARQFYRKILEDAPTSKHAANAALREYEIASEFLSGFSETKLLIFSATDPEFGIEILTQLVEEYPYESFSAGAWQLIARYRHRTGQYYEAAEAYSILARKYSTSDYASDAAFFIGNCYMQLFESIDYDMTNMNRARAAYKLYTVRFPSSGRIEEARKRIARIDELLAKKELKTAYYYLYNEKYLAAKIYFKGIVDKYPATVAAKSAAFELKKLSRYKMPGDSSPEEVKAKVRDE